MPATQQAVTQHQLQQATPQHGFPWATLASSDPRRRRGRPLTSTVSASWCVLNMGGGQGTLMTSSLRPLASVVDSRISTLREEHSYCRGKGPRGHGGKQHRREGRGSTCLQSVPVAVGAAAGMCCHSTGTVQGPQTQLCSCRVWRSAPILQRRQLLTTAAAPGCCFGICCRAPVGLSCPLSS